MAGYIFSLDNLESLKMYIRNGIYATKLNIPKKINYWKKHHEATLADYLTMKEGDNVYFFIKRKIYGIGKLTNIHNGCKFSNFPEACEPKFFEYQEKKNILLWDEGAYSVNQRWLCVFKPAPHFFKNGIDMDDVLASNPLAFKMLRTLWQLSFLKFDDEENQAFKDVILKFNSSALTEPKEENIFTTDYRGNHNNIFNKIKSGTNYKIDILPILSSCSEGNKLTHEMAIEAGVLNQIANFDENTSKIFGRWDYLSHQVVASPFKPIMYMDKMDLFGYRYIKGFKPTRSKYLIGEIKKDKATINDIEQLIKYVDWVKDEYCYGDYGMINAFLIAYNFDEELIKYRNNSVSRKYIINRRPARTYEWNNLNFVKYSYDRNQLALKLVE
jgi:hypothetical protein